VTIDLQKSLSDQFLDVFRDRDATREFLVRHISLETLPVFLSDLKAATKAASNRDALLFIHGYNVSFDDACRRAAQLAYDIKFQGQIILYSWPSHASVLNYAGDEEMTEWSQPHFNVFLKQLLSGSEISRLHVIAHSMGNRLLTGALFSNVLTEKEISHLGELVLAAPDVNRLIFDQYPGFKKRMTLYASDRDQALRLSKWFHGYSRAGDARPDIDIKAGMDSIDASAVDTSFLGHSYIGDSRSVLADVAALIPAGTEPIKRFGTVMAGPPSRSWWVIKP
jgi:esterase/lipase superfamily enzyme